MKLKVTYVILLAICTILATHCNLNQFQLGKICYTCWYKLSFCIFNRNLHLS